MYLFSVCCIIGCKIFIAGCLVLAVQLKMWGFLELDFKLDTFVLRGKQFSIPHHYQCRIPHTPPSYQTYDLTWKRTTILYCILESHAYNSTSCKVSDPRSLNWISSWKVRKCGRVISWQWVAAGLQWLAGPLLGPDVYLLANSPARCPLSALVVQTNAIRRFVITSTAFTFKTLL